MKPALFMASFAVLFAVLVMSALAQAPETKIGLFDSHGDVGMVLHEGSVKHDDSKETYTLTGSGENVWSTTDAFQFVWKKVSGDVHLEKGRL